MKKKNRKRACECVTQCLNSHLLAYNIFFLLLSFVGRLLYFMIMLSLFCRHHHQPMCANIPSVHQIFSHWHAQRKKKCSSVHFFFFSFLFTANQFVRFRLSGGIWCETNRRIWNAYVCGYEMIFEEDFCWNEKITLQVSQVRFWYLFSELNLSNKEKSDRNWSMMISFGIHSLDGMPREQERERDK